MQTGALLNMPALAEAGWIISAILLREEGYLTIAKRTRVNMNMHALFFGTAVPHSLLGQSSIMKCVGWMAIFLLTRKKLIFAGACNYRDIPFMYVRHQSYII